MMKELVLSYAIGFLIFAFLYAVAAYGAAHQLGPFGTIGYVVAGIIDLPTIMLYGADGSRRPPALFSVALYLTEAGLIAIPIYFLFFKG